MQGQIAVLALADDTTGAMEVGAAFLEAGLRTLVTLGEDKGAPDGCEALVVDTFTRHASGAEARSRVERIVRSVGARRVFKKTDSTLRGNIVAELAGVAAARPGETIIYAPAYPAQGRVVRDGVLYVNGVPLADTAFARDPRGPVVESSVRRLVGALPVVVCDGESDADLAMTAAAQPALAAGPGGFAREWAKALGYERQQPRASWPAQKLLVVCGSLHPASREQVRKGPHLDVIMTSDQPSGGRDAVLKRLATHVRRALELECYDALAVFGGDTARAVLEELGVTRAEPLGEILAGVPVSSIRANGRQVVVATKAGGFGDPDILDAIGRYFQQTA